MFCYFELQAYTPRYKIGDAFVHLPLEEAQGLLTSSTEQIDSEVTKLEETLDELEVAAVACEQERGVSVVVCLVNVKALLKKPFNDFCASAVGSREEDAVAVKVLLLEGGAVGEEELHEVTVPAPRCKEEGSVAVVVALADAESLLEQIGEQVLVATTCCLEDGGVVLLVVLVEAATVREEEVDNVHVTAVHCIEERGVANDVPAVEIWVELVNQPLDEVLVPAPAGVVDHVALALVVGVAVAPRCTVLEEGSEDIELAALGCKKDSC